MYQKIWAFLEPLKETEQLVDVLTSSLQPVKPYHAAGADPYFEVDTFEEIPQQLAAPFENYLNHLYIRPISLKYDAQKSFPKARNITISCELWNGDEPASSRKLCVFYTRPETRGLIFDTSRTDSKLMLSFAKKNNKFWDICKYSLFHSKI